MVDVWLPYGKTDVCVRVPARNLLGTIEPKEQQAVVDAKAEVERALKEPVGSKRLSEIVKPESKVAIVVDVATRKTPSELMLLPVLTELNAAGVKDENITVVFGCGTYKAVKPEEAAALIGAEAVKRVKSISHDSRAADLVNVGTTKTHGNRVFVNRVFAEADVKVLLGDVDLHYYAGYGGGRKGVLPGVCGEETIRQRSWKR
jgi:nickel-dependent lactate racemase